MIDMSGRERIAEAVRAQMELGHDLTGRVSEATLERVMRLEPVSEVMLLAVGEALGMPAGYLLEVGRGLSR